MREVSRDEQFPVEQEFVDALLAVPAPVDAVITELRRLNEATLANTALLMRLYDIHMAQLKLMGEEGMEEAQRLYSAHDSGEHWNPTIFVPEFANKEDSE